MRKLMHVVLTVIALSLVALSVAWAQGQGPGQQGRGGGAGGPGGGFGGRGPGGPGGFGGTPEERAARMLEFRSQMLDQMQVSAAEKTAALAAAKAKSDARTKLQEKLTALREATDNPQATDASIAKSLNEFVTAQTAYNKSVADADNGLVKKVSVRTRARLTVAGFIENGVGGGGFGGFGGFGGRGGPGGPGGFGGRGGPGGPGGGQGGRPGGSGQSGRDRSGLGAGI